MKKKPKTQCGQCANFPDCSKLQVKNVKKETDHCQWPETIKQFKPREKDPIPI